MFLTSPLCSPLLGGEGKKCSPPPPPRALVGGRDGCEVIYSWQDKMGTSSQYVKIDSEVNAYHGRFE